MSISMFAAIHIGSGDVSMKIFECSKKNHIREIDSVKQAIELGTDTYRTGKISHELVNELCEILLRFRTKMKEYQILDYTACATSAVREAGNCVHIIDQIFLRCDLQVQILSNSEQRFIYYKAIALHRSNFDKVSNEGTAVVDVGGGSIQISVLEDATLTITQNILLGSLRIREALGDLESQTLHFNYLMFEYVNNDIKVFKEVYLHDHRIENIITMGESVDLLAACMRPSDSDFVTRKQFMDFYEVLSHKTIEQIISETPFTKEQVSLLLPSAMVYYKIFQETDAKMMWIPRVTLCDGLATEYAQKSLKLIPNHDFSSDIIRASRHIASRYHSDTKHSSNVEEIALAIFDSIRKLHGLGKRERLLLQIAVILHNCGEYINMSSVAENSYHIIMATEIIGISHTEREMIASIVKYTHNSFPRTYQTNLGFDNILYIKISKLTAILRISNALDRSHKQKFQSAKIIFKDGQLTITTTTLEDITLEKSLFLKKSDLFEEVFGIRPILKQKRNIET